MNGPIGTVKTKLDYTRVPMLIQFGSTKAPNTALTELEDMIIMMHRNHPRPLLLNPKPNGILQYTTRRALFPICTLGQKDSATQINGASPPPFNAVKSPLIPKKWNL